MEDSVIGFTNANTPAYGHALLHLKLLQPDWLVLPEQSPLGFIIDLLGLVVLVLWIQRGKRRLHLQGRLDDEGQMSACAGQCSRLQSQRSSDRRNWCAQFDCQYALEPALLGTDEKVFSKSRGEPHLDAIASFGSTNFGAALQGGSKIR